MFHKDTTPLSNAKAEMLHETLDELMRKLNIAGCTTKMIGCNEQFKTLIHDVQDKMNLTMDYRNAGAHKSDKEQINRVIEEWHRMTMQQLPCKTAPKVMIGWRHEDPFSMAAVSCTQ